MVPVVVALLVIGGVVAGTQGWFSGNSSTTANPSPSGAAGPAGSGSDPSTTSATATPEPSSTPSASADPSTTPSADAPGSSSAQQALDDCRAKVKAADRTVKAAEVGIGHWSEHVQAQTDANDGKISVAKMDSIFKRTRLAGPDDLQRYADAVRDAKDTSASCKAPDGASASVQDTMSDCAARSKAQQPVLAAAEDGMDDWKSHLAAMQRSRMGHVHDAQGVWIRAWKAAPPHIKAFDKAEKKFDAPAC